MKYRCIFILSFFFIQLSWSQKVTVLEAVTMDPIPGVSIYNETKNKSVITDIEGEADLSVFDADEFLFFHNFLYKDLRLNKSTLNSMNYRVFLNPSVEALNQIVLSASKFQQRKRDIPRKIISFSEESIKFANPQTSADLLENTGNIFIQKSQLGGGSPMIRGFSTNRLLITVDGVRMNNAIFRGGNIQNVISIDPLSVQNTEITLGSGSVVYGSDAIGGVMSFYTKRPELSLDSTVQRRSTAMIRYASANNEKTGHVDFNLGYEKWGFLTNISYNDYDDLRMGSHGPDDYLRPNYVIREDGEDVLVTNPNPEIQVPTAYSQINLMQKIRYQPISELNFDLGLYYTTTSDYPRYDRLIRPRGDSLRSAEWKYGPQQWFMGNLQVTKLSSRSSFYDKIKVTAAYQNFKESRQDRNFQSPIREVREEQVNVFSFNGDLEKRLNFKTSLFYGIEYLFNTVQSEAREENIDTNTSSENVTRYPNGSTWQSLAAYMNLKYKASTRFIFQSGLRYNQVITSADFTANNEFLNLPFSRADINTGALTGSVGFTWLPDDMIQWKLNFSTAFRAPNIDDIGKVFDSEPGAVVIPNNDLKSEYAYGGELGLKLNLDNKLVLDMATYYTFLDDALVRRNSELNGEAEIIYDGELSAVQSIQNASKAWIYGFEVALNYNFSKDWKLRSLYNIIGGTEEIDDVEVPVRHVAPDFGRTHLIWDTNKWVFDLFAVYNSELSFDELALSELSKDYIYASDENGNPYSPSWYTLNLRTQYQLNNRLVFTASVENITDQRYRPYSSGISAPGRNFILSMRYTL